MKPSLNLVMLIGELVDPADVRTTASGQTKASFRIGTQRRIPDGRVFTDRHSVVWWGRDATSAEDWKVGDIVQVTGRSGTRSYETKGSNEKKWITEITARDVALFGSEDEGDSPSPSRPPPRRGGHTPDPDDDRNDDDIPF